MKVQNYRDVRPDTELPGVALHTVISADDSPRFAMRVFEVAQDSSTPYHVHAWEHEVFVLSGRGIVRGLDGARALAANDAVYVAPGEEHCFTNTGSDVFRFICCIPHRTDAMPDAETIACDG